ncbi:MAG: LssY C-terminal domain-containing protein [Candidatus Korobacteraceae bacterium]
MSDAYTRKIPAYFLLAILLVSCISAQESTATPARLTIPDGTPVTLRLAENVSSAHARVGERLDFVVVRDVNLDGFTVIPAGTMARGSITGVKGKRFLGIGGNVALKLDSVELANGDRVNLRARMDVKGRSRTKLMAAAMVATSLIFLPATPVFLLTRGHDSTVVKSTEITAQIEGATPVLSAGLAPSQENGSQLAEMMDYLPPRVFNGEGREGDMLNLVFVAQQEDLQDAFQRAGWVKTDKWKMAFVWHLLRHGIDDTRVPMARFYLFGRVQDYSYALPDPNAIVSRRHHLRIWKTGYTMDGTPIWAGAATHDVSIEIAKRGHLINHRIDPAVDEERDFVGTNLADASSVSRREYLHGMDPVFQAQTDSGEPYHSDSRILLLDIHQITATKTSEPSQSAAVVRVATPPIAAPTESFQSNLTALH